MQATSVRRLRVALAQGSAVLQSPPLGRRGRPWTTAIIAARVGPSRLRSLRPRPSRARRAGVLDAGARARRLAARRAGRETEQAVEWALEAGYRHIDTDERSTATSGSVGAALARSGLPREQLFVTDQVAAARVAAPASSSPAEPRAARARSRSSCTSSTGPCPGRAPGAAGGDVRGARRGPGSRRAVGVSNYGVAIGSARLAVRRASARRRSTRCTFSPLRFPASARSSLLPRSVG